MKSMFLPQLSAIAMLLGVAASSVLAAGSPDEFTREQADFFETKIRPVLAGHCYKCHSAESGKTKGGLAVDTRAALLAGGDSGLALIPGDPRGSLLILALSYRDDDLQMPPKEPLPEAVVNDFAQWVRMGAPDPRGTGVPEVVRGEIDLEEARKFWAYQLPGKPPLPKVADQDWPRSDIDRFLLARMESEGIEPVADADKRTLIRRVYFDLTGLPPGVEAVEEFVGDDSPEAWAGVVDGLLDSPRFGERWGRHWLDVARYAESSGKEANFTFPHAWRYRDYVIDSFNADKPYDQFITEQIAGDLLPVEDELQRNEFLTATAFLALGPKSLNEANPKQFAMDLVDEQIDTMSRAILGTTIACARCHDHKFDPITTHEYYSLAGVFLSSETYYGTPQVQGNRRSSELIHVRDDSEPVDPGMVLSPSERRRLETELERATEQRRELFIQARNARRSNDISDQEQARIRRSLRRLNDRVNTLEAQLESHDELGLPRQFTMGVRERLRPIDARLLVRGEIDKAADPVERGFVQVLYHGEPPRIDPRESGRLQLAEWLTSPNNPLTARVMVNRIWHHLFGRGLVPTMDNFGSTGQPPSHPELLDHLAVRFQENGWSVKSAIREIVLSRAYRLGSGFEESHFRKDPENALVWRMNKRRLEAECLHDALLAIGGTLDLDRPHGSPVGRVGDGYVGRNIGEEQIQRESDHRAVYLPVVRDMVPEALAAFDFAEPSLVTGDRDTTTVPSQALYLMNSDFVAGQAEGFARRLVQMGLTDIELIERASLEALARRPSDREVEQATRFFERFVPAVRGNGVSRERARFAALKAYCQALFAGAEFRYLD